MLTTKKLNTSSEQVFPVPKQQEKKNQQVTKKTNQCAKNALSNKEKRPTLRRQKRIKQINPKEKICYFDDEQFHTPLPKPPRVSGSHITPLTPPAKRSPVFASAPILQVKKPKLPKDERIFREIRKKEILFLQTVIFLTRNDFDGKKTVAGSLHAHKAIDDETFRVLKAKEIILREIGACVKSLIGKLNPKSNISFKSQLLLAFNPISFQSYIDALHHYVLLHQKNENILKKIANSSEYQLIEKKFAIFAQDQNNLDSQFIKAVQHLPRFVLLLERFCKTLVEDDCKKFAPILKKIRRELALIGASNNTLSPKMVKFKLSLGEAAFDSIIQDEKALQILHNEESSTPDQHALKYLISKLRVQSHSTEEDLLVLDMYESPLGIRLLSTTHRQTSPRKQGNTSKKFDKSVLLHIAEESLLRSIRCYQKKYGVFEIDASNLEEVMKDSKLNRKFELYMTFTKQEKYLRAYYAMEDLIRMAKNLQRSRIKLEMFIMVYLEDSSPMRLDYLKLDSQKICSDAKRILKGLGHTEITGFATQIQKALLVYLRKHVEGKLISRTKKSSSF